MEQECDVLIIGSGPSGCAAAIWLAQAGLKVCLVDKGQASAPLLAENYCLRQEELLQKLGIAPLALAAAIEQECRVQFLHPLGTAEMEITLRHRGHLKQHLMRVNKSMFNQCLQKQATMAGVYLQRGVEVIACHANDDEGWQVESKCDGKLKKIDCRYIVDASGKTGLLSKAFMHAVVKRQLDPRVACFSHFSLPKPLDDLAMRIVPLDSGYLFAIPLTSQRISVGIAVSEKRAQCYPTLAALFVDLIQEAPVLQAYLLDAEQVLPVLPVLNNETICQFPAGPGYFICGEAAAFIDPFFSNGIDIALTMGILAAEATIGLLKSPPDAAKIRQAYVDEFHALLAHERNAIHNFCHSSEWISLLCGFADPHLPHIIQLFLIAHFSQLKPPKRTSQHLLQAAREVFSTCA